MMQRDPSCTSIALVHDEVEAMRGLGLLDFGTDWCGHCLGARSAVDAWIGLHEDIAHVRIEDGRGRPLGRAYRVKLWPTLVLLRDGREIARVVRPHEARDLFCNRSNALGEVARQSAGRH